MAICLLGCPRENRFLGRFDVRSTLGHFYGLRVVMRFDESVPLSGMMFLLRLYVHLKSVYVLRSLFFCWWRYIPATVVVAWSVN